MTGFEIFTLIILIVFVATGVAYQFSKHHGSLKDMVQDVREIEVKAEEIVNELYNKDLRPITSNKPPKKKQVTSQDVTPELVDVIAQKAKITPQDATIELQAVIQEIKKDKAEFPIDKPKSKKKFYPKKPKTHI